MTLHEMAAIAAEAKRLGLLKPADPEPQKRRRSWNTGVRRQDFPRGAAGHRAYNTAYQMAKRRAEGLKPRVREIPVARSDFPPGPAGKAAYNKAYQAAYRKARRG